MKLKVHSIPSMPSKPIVKNTRSYKLYQDLRIQLEKFLDCLYDQDFSSLIISNPENKKISFEELQDSWNKIYLAYWQIASGGIDNPVISCIKQIEEINAKLIFVDSAVIQLASTFDQDIVDMLNYFGLRCKIKKDDPTLYKQLYAITNRARRWVIDQGEIRARLEKLQADQTEKGSQREEFDDAIIAISKYQGYGVKASDITVAQYLKVMKRMEDEWNKLQMRA